MKRTIVGLGLLALALVLLFNATPAHATGLDKGCVDCPDPVGIYLDGPTTFIFEITIGDGPTKVFDTVPAEFKVVSAVSPVGVVDFFSAKKNGNGKSATKIEWFVPGDGCISPPAILTVTIETRPSPGKGHKDPETGEPVVVYKPTSCGPLLLNDGAIAYEADDFGNLVLDGDGNPILMYGPTLPIVVQAGPGAKPCDN
jgi:hypothetical protein